MIQTRDSRPGVASLAVLLILVITAAWWALALWSAGTGTPEWLARTRAACFGSGASGLPDASGWALLIGQPIGMLGVVIAVWGKSLRADLRRIRASRPWSLIAIAVLIGTVAASAAAARTVIRATGIGAASPATPTGLLGRLDLDASSIQLVDQHGRTTSMANAATQPALLTFAFGHCATVCPTMVHDLKTARSRAGRNDVPLMVISLDPWRDTPARLAGLAAKWELHPNDLVFSGEIDDVVRALDLLGIGYSRDLNSGDIDHVGTVMLLDERGHVTARLDAGWGKVDQLLAEIPTTQPQ